MRQLYDAINYEELTVGGVLVRDGPSKLERNVNDFLWAAMDTVDLSCLIPETIDIYRKVRRERREYFEEYGESPPESWSDNPAKALGVIMGAFAYPFLFYVARLHFELDTPIKWGMPALLVGSNIISLLSVLRDMRRQ